MIKPKADKIFFTLVLILITIGFVIFLSASQSLLSGSNEASFYDVALKQFGVLVVGIFALALASRLPYKSLKRAAFWIYLFSILLNILVFVPKIGIATGGAHRWLNLGPASFQPSEFLKFGYILYLAFWLAQSKDKMYSLVHGLLPFLTITAAPALLLIAEPDTGTFMVLFASGLAVFIAGGGRWRHILLLFIISVLSIGVLAFFKPYIRDRIETFINPKNDVLGSSYQINQSMIAIGGGGFSGRGFGQSIQKFNFLPEAIGDSIFAVAAEEFGFIGSTILVILFMGFALWGLKIASRIPDAFGRLLALGIVILVTAQSFINISAMLGIIPLTGVPLIFISHGGSALIIALIEVGIILNISKYQTA